MMMFAHKVALVTGGSSGIGRATALAFGREGARVVVADLDAGGGRETVDMVENAGSEALFIRTDVTKMAEVAEMVTQAVSAFGRLDCAFNNAGVEPSGSVLECTEEAWDRTIAVNLKSVWICMKHELPQMLEQGEGVIVNTSSVAGLVGSAAPSDYSASKHGVIGLTKSEALLHAGRGIRINAICPGVTATPMDDRVIRAHPQLKGRILKVSPIGRRAQPEEIANAVVWLCSDAASFVIGHALAIDGGWSAR